MFTLFRISVLTLFSVLSCMLVAADTNPLATLKPTHPRLFVEPGEWSAIKAKSEADPLLKKVIAQLKGEADRLALLPPVERKKHGRRLLSVSREALHRISVWSMMRHLENDLSYAKRAEEEMRAIVQFSDWNPSHFLDVAEMTSALAIGYDWLYEDLNAEARETIRNGIIRLGLKPGRDAIRNGAWWASRDINWNQVCLGGLTIGALAVADDVPELAEELLIAARKGIPNGLSVYAPDGVYPEGPSYWSYGTVYQCMMIDALRSALGTSWEMEATPGFLDSARAQAQLTGPSGRFFNFADGREGPSFQVPLLWFASELEEPEVLRGQKAILEARLKKPASKWMAVFPILWWPEAFSTTAPAALPLAWKGEGLNPVAVFRSSWTDPDALYLACKGGSASVSHAHMDAGSFVLEANGIRWAVDLGMQSYYDLESEGIDLWASEQDGGRWDVFRLNNRSHNTLTIDNQLHRVNGTAEFTYFDSTSAVLNLSDIFGYQAQQVTRRFEVKDRNVTIIDNLKGLEAGANVRWKMATRADVTIEGSRAILRQDGETLVVKMQAPSNGQLQVIPADPPDDDFNAANPDTYLLIVDTVAPASGEVMIEMHFEPSSDLQNKKVPDLSFRSYELPGLLKEDGVVRRDPSDVIQVNDRYHVYYTKVIQKDIPGHSRHLRTSGYPGTIWHASSSDGKSWTESGPVLKTAEKGKWDSFGVFTPGILKHKGKFWLYYTGVQPTPGNPDGAFENNSANDTTAIGVAVADSPEGPFRRYSDEAILNTSEEPKAFDSYRVDDACLLIREGKVWLYYKGRSLIKGDAGPRHTEMGVASAEHPAGPFTKLNGGKSVQNSGHEVQVSKYGSGVLSLVSDTGPNGRTLQYAEDGIHFEILKRDLKNMPAAPGLYRPELVEPDAKAKLPKWGISMVYRHPHLMRFDCVWAE